MVTRCAAGRGGGRHGRGGRGGPGLANKRRQAQPRPCRSAWSWGAGALPRPSARCGTSCPRGRPPPCTFSPA
eukprot:5691415-Pyramimonas_sp.AAC.1